MWYRIKISREINQQGIKKPVTEYYLTDAKNFAYAGLKVIDNIGKNIEVEDILLMKSYKPAINEYKQGNKVYIVKIAEDMTDENGNVKTLKYPMPVFANNDAELYVIVKDFIKQGLNDMRLTTISETKWIFLS